VNAAKNPLAPIRALGGVCARNYLSRLNLSTSLGSANEIKYLVYIIVEPVCISPIFLQIAISCLHAKGLGAQTTNLGVRSFGRAK
jgi:hypothetical protein